MTLCHGANLEVDDAQAAKAGAVETILDAVHRGKGTANETQPKRWA